VAEKYKLSIYFLPNKLSIYFLPNTPVSAHTLPMLLAGEVT